MTSGKYPPVPPLKGLHKYLMLLFATIAAVVEIGAYTVLTILMSILGCLCMPLLLMGSWGKRFFARKVVNTLGGTPSILIFVFVSHRWDDSRLFSLHLFTARS